MLDMHCKLEYKQPLTDLSWNTIIDTSRQALFAFHTGNPGDIEPATLTFRSAVLAVQRFAEVRPDVSLAIV